MSEGRRMDTIPWTTIGPILYTISLTILTINVVVTIPSFLLILLNVVPNRSAWQPYHLLLYVESILNMLPVAESLIDVGFPVLLIQSLQRFIDPIQKRFAIVPVVARQFIQVFIVLSAITWMQL